MRLVKWLPVTTALLLACAPAPVPRAAPPPREIEVLEIQPTEVRDTGEYLGVLQSRRSVVVLPEVAGYVRHIAVAPGQVVTAGQPLVEIDAREDAAALRSAEAQQRSAAAALALAKSERARAQVLHAEGLASGQELDRAVSAVEAADASARVASAAVDQGSVRLGLNVVRAPFAGTVGEVRIRLGERVTPTTPLTAVAQADLLEVTVAVPATRARRLAPNTRVELLDTDDSVLVESTLFYIAPEADPRTQLVEVKAAFANTIGLRPSEVVRARVVYAQRSALELPVLGVVRQSGQPFAMVVREQDGHTRVERRPVTLGALGETAYVVEAGLEPGDRVAITSLQALRDGASVRIRSSAPRVVPPAPVPTGMRL